MEPLKNLSPFYIGQEVLCINSNYVSDEIVFNKTYTVLDTVSYCKCTLIRIGISQEKEEGTNNIIECRTVVRCHNCKCLYITDGLRRFLASRFCPIQQQSFPLMTYSKVIKKELISAN